MRRFVAHLPQIALSEGVEDIRLDGAVIRCMSFDSWHEVDNAYPFRDRNFERTAPAFFEMELPTPPDTDVAVERFLEFEDPASALLNTVYTALVVISAFRLLDPRYSMAYLVDDDTDRLRVLHRVGPANREFILFGYAADSLELSVERVPSLLYVVRALAPPQPELEPLLDALRRTTRPLTSTMLEAVHLVGGLEALLVDPTEPLTETFARRFAVLGAQRHSHDRYAMGRRLYEIRSALMHGRPVAPGSLTSEVESFLDIDMRPLVCEMTLRALNRLAATNGDRRRLHADLDASFEDADRFEELRASWSFPI